MAISLSEFAQGLKVETAFDVLAIARKLKSSGKDVIELQIGDSPFPSTRSAKMAGIRAIEEDQSHYCASLGLPEFREVIAERMRRDYGIRVTQDNIVVGPGAKVFEQFFCEAVLNPDDEVLVFTPHFPTYLPNIHRRQGKVVFSPLRQENDFRPNLNDVAAFVRRERARGIFLNSPHNPTGGVATREDLAGIAAAIRGTRVALFSDEPYEHMVWRGRHHSPLAEEGILDQTVAAYTFSKSYSMSGWRAGYAVGGSMLAESIGKMINTTLSCVPPIVQRAAAAAIAADDAERDELMGRFRKKVERLSGRLAQVPEVRVAPPAGTFYVFPNVAVVCNRLRITSHGLAMYLLEGADERMGVACLGGECFGDAGGGFLRFSCAEPDDRLDQAVDFLADAWNRTDRVERYLNTRPGYRLAEDYVVPPSPSASH